MSNAMRGLKSVPWTAQRLLRTVRHTRQRWLRRCAAGAARSQLRDMASKRPIGSAT